MRPRWALMVTLAACSGRAVDDRQRLPDFAPRGAVVARVAGEPITSEQVELFARDLHVSAREALDRAVEMHLLAREARRRGVVSDDDLREFAWHARLQLLIERDVERGVTDATLRPADVASVRAQRAMDLDAPAAIRVVHFLVKTPERPTAAQRAGAIARAQAFRRRVVETSGERPTAAAFNAVAAAVRVGDDVCEGVGPFDAEGHMGGGGGLVPEFAAGAWRLSAQAPLSEPIVTPFGAHIVLLVAEFAPARRPPDEVVRVVRRDMVIRGRSEAAQALVQRLRATHQVHVNAEALTSVQSLSREPPRP